MSNILKGAAAVVLTTAFTACSHDMDYYNPGDAAVDTYNKIFVKTFGQPHKEQTWGFGETTTRGITRSQAAPAVPHINKPLDEDSVARYLLTAKEPDATNVNDNYDNGHMQEEVNTWIEGKKLMIQFTTTMYTASGDDYTWKEEWVTPYQTGNYSKYGVSTYDEATPIVKQLLDNNGHSNWYVVTQQATEGHYETTPARWVSDETYVRRFKITGTYNGTIGVAASEGLTDNAIRSNAERTIFVTGTWNITDNQRIGSLGKIVIANGGTVNVAEGVMLNMVNQAQLIVLPGGKLTGNGTVEVNNGNAVGQENYNGGTIDVAVFNNNFGKFYNYGKFLVTEYRGGAKESNFYNHRLVSIKHTGLGSETPNARIFNACQWYCEGDMRCRNYEGIQGSAFIVGGQLMVSSSEDGTDTPTYFSLDNGALVKVGSLYNNGTSWSGPEEGWAALEIDNQIDYLNWQQDAPEDGGYFENNIYVKCGTWDNIPTGNGFHAGETATADYKFWNVVANCRGNNNVTKVNDGNNELLPADDDFVLGQAGCTPGFTGDIPQEETWGDWLCVIAEDLSVTTLSDFDFNDVVFDVRINSTKTKAQIKLKAAGGTLPLTVGWSGAEGTSYTDYEVHNLFGVATNVMVNTHARTGVDGKPYVTKTLNGTFNNPNDVKVMVMKSGEWVEITAHKGKPASKLAVSTEYVWCNERENINDRYANFSKYVQENTLTEWWKNE